MRPLCPVPAHSGTAPAEWENRHSATSRNARHNPPHPWGKQGAIHTRKRSGRSPENNHRPLDLAPRADAIDFATLGFSVIISFIFSPFVVQ